MTRTTESVMMFGLSLLFLCVLGLFSPLRHSYTPPKGTESGPIRSFMAGAEAMRATAKNRDLV